jgi:N-acetylmuramoyl-L-alanine amidase
VRIYATPLLFLLVCLLLAGCAGSASHRLHTASGGTPHELFSTGQTVLPPEPALAPPPTDNEAARTNSVAPAAPKPAPDPFAKDTWIPVKRWAASLHLRGPMVLEKESVRSFELRSDKGVLVFWIGYRGATWNGMSLDLGFAPQVINGEPFLHATDIRKNARPLLIGGNELELPETPVLVLDPGHGGVDSGTFNNQGQEKRYTLDWALRAAALLRTNGWRVVLTRTNDSELSLSNRVAIANREEADLFVSLHFNSAGTDERRQGVETYCLTPKGMPSTITREYSDDLGMSFPNNLFDDSNLRLAARVHQKLLEVNGGLDRGIRRARFMGVLRSQMRPSILVEGAYLSSPREAGRVAEAAYRQRLAVALAEALLGRKLNEPEPKEPKEQSDPNS